MTKWNDPAEVEKWLIANRDAKSADPSLLNLPTHERKDKHVYQAKKAALDYSEYLSSAEQHYAIARLLCSTGGPWIYGFFCAQQMVETYLKAFLKMNGSEPPDIHDLDDLLKLCRDLGTGDQFVDGPHIDVIAAMFNPFNEFARYPVYKKGPQGNAVATSVMDAVFTMDYFVFKMRSSVPMPSDRRSLFGEGHIHFGVMQADHPKVYEFITANNINFGG